MACTFAPKFGNRPTARIANSASRFLPLGSLAVKNSNSVFSSRQLASIATVAWLFVCRRFIAPPTAQGHLRDLQQHDPKTAQKTSKCNDVPEIARKNSRQLPRIWHNLTIFYFLSPHRQTFLQPYVTRTDTMKMRRWLHRLTSPFATFLPPFATWSTNSSPLTRRRYSQVGLHRACTSAGMSPGSHDFRPMPQKKQRTQSA